MECLIDKSVNNHPKHYVNYHCLDNAIAPTYTLAPACPYLTNMLFLYSSEKE